MRENKFEITFNIAWQRELVNDFVYIYNLNKNEFILLENMSKDIWMMLIEEKRNINDIVLRIYDEYDIELNVLEKDIEDFIDELEYLKIIKVLK